MKTIANRMIVFAASVIAFGTVAFGQTRMTAEIPFAFHTVNGMLPAGTYEIRETSSGVAHIVLLRNTATEKGTLAGNPIYNVWRTVANGPVVEFVCAGSRCSLKAIRTSVASLEYQAPGKSKDGEKMAVVSISMKPVNAD
jgi:hypothetical protein